MYESERSATRKLGVRVLMSISPSQSTTYGLVSEIAGLESRQRRTVFSLWLNLDQDFTLAHYLYYFADVTARFMKQL